MRFRLLRGIFIIGVALFLITVEAILAFYRIGDSAMVLDYSQGDMLRLLCVALCLVFGILTLRFGSDRATNTRRTDRRMCFDLFAVCSLLVVTLMVTFHMAETLGLLSDHHWETVYYPRIDQACRESGLERLRGFRVRGSEEEIRIWAIEAGIAGVVLRKEKDLWEGWHVSLEHRWVDGVARVSSVKRSIRPSSGWGDLISKLHSQSITTLPDMSELPAGQTIMFHGVAYVFEILEGRQYRAYEYDNPGAFPESPEARQVIEILKIIEMEFDDCDFPPLAGTILNEG